MGMKFLSKPITFNTKQKHQYFDYITKLPNINYLTKDCPLTIFNTCDKQNCFSLKNKNLNKAFICIGIDHFRLLNEAVGFAYGNEILILLAHRLHKLISANDILARLFSDEFLMIIHFESHTTLKETINQLNFEINKPFLLNGKSISITCSIGVSVYPDDGICMENLIKQAEIAMYHVKHHGKNNFAFYNTTFGSNVMKRFDVVSEIKHSLDSNYFILHYQPKADIKSGNITGLEALVRWNHPKKGLIYPNDFIPIAEEKGIIKEIDIKVLELACEQIKSWEIQGKTIFNISVNISPIFFNDQKFIQIVDSIISKIGISSKHLSFEITENVNLKDLEQTKRIINKLKDRNINIYIDDFGKGYSSLNYLKDLNLDYLKIDKSFMDDIHIDPKTEKLIEMIVSISKVYGFKIVAEGIESPEQLNFLNGLGCDEYQGYLLSKPHPIDELLVNINNLES